MDTGESTIETGGTTETVVGGMDKDTRMWAMILHFSTLAVFVLPVIGWVAPIVIWQIKKEDMPPIDAHGKMVTNFVISMVIYNVVAFLLWFIFIGFLVSAALWVIMVIFPIIGGIKANNGELWKYPLTISLIN